MRRTPEQMRLIFRLRLGLFVVGAVVLTGTIGYHLIEDLSWLESLYMTAITVSTVGFKEVRELSAAGRVFTITMILGGVGSIAFLGSSLLEWIIEQHSGRMGWRNRMQRRIDALNGHIIVCGYGRMGRYVINQLEAAQTPFVVVEKDPDLCAALEEREIHTVRGDATDEDVLEAAGIARAGALVAALGADAENLYLTLTAHGMQADIRVIVRAEEQASHAKFIRAGAHKVVSPYRIGADHIVQLLLRPSVVDFIDLVTHQENLELDIDQTEVTKDSALADKSIMESRVRQSLGRMILAIKRPDGTSEFDPAPETVLRPGDILVTIGRGNAGGGTK